MIRNPYIDTIEIMIKPISGQILKSFSSEENQKTAKVIHEYAATFIANSLNDCLNKGVFPYNLKVVYKKDNSFEKGNYWPTSISSLMFLN